MATTTKDIHMHITLHLTVFFSILIVGAAFQISPLHPLSLSSSSLSSLSSSPSSFSASYLATPVSPSPKQFHLFQSETKLFSSSTETDDKTSIKNDIDVNVKTERSVDLNEDSTITTTTRRPTSNTSTNNDNDNDASCWNPKIRKVFTALSTIGMAETGYLSYIKLFDPNGMNNICGGGGGTGAAAASEGLSSCSAVLNSPYATIQISNEVGIPLTLAGFFAYAAVAILSVGPLLFSKSQSQSQQVEDSDAGADIGVDLDVSNRIAILCTTTSMATFSSFLLSLLYTTIHQWCPYCILSAVLSLSMGFTAWTSNTLPTINRTSRELGAKLGLGSFVTTTAASLLFFLTLDQSAITAYQNNVDIMAANGLTSNNIVATAREVEKNVPPPPITSSSSDRALKIGEDMKELNTRFFGAYWCSHCYDQKQRLGKEAMANVEYIECSKEGLNSQNALCKERGVPGYPTWEIGGKLYPGEMYLDELEEIIAKAKGSL